MSMSTDSTNYTRPSHLIALLAIAMTACTGVEADRDAARRGELQVIASAHAVGDTSWTIQGRIIHLGKPVANASVYAIATSENGQADASLSEASDALGAFLIPNVPMSLGYSRTKERMEVEIFASAARDTSGVIEGSSVLILDPTRQKRWVPLSITAVLVVPLMFLISIGIALWDVPMENSILALRKWYVSVFLSLIFAFTMIGYIALGLRMVNATESNADVLSLGFANIYQASYVENTGDEWVFSLTSPPSLAQEDELDRGFGAPLWVILLTVVGSVLFTISLIVKQAKKPIEEQARLEVRSRVQEIINHQFFILFAPLGAVIIYQMQVKIEAASSTIAVALVALASGVAINLVLEHTLRLVEGLMRPGGSTVLQRDRRAPTPSQDREGY